MPMTNQEAAAAFHCLADLLEQNPLMHQPYEGLESPILFFCHDRPSFVATVKAFGVGKKDHDENSLHFIPDFPLQIKVFGFKSSICATVTHPVVVPEQVIPAKPATPAEPEQVIPAHEELVTEYVCTPFLRVDEPAPMLEPAPELLGPPALEDEDMVAPI